jgi:hypothetical protein
VNANQFFQRCQGFVCVGFILSCGGVTAEEAAPSQGTRIIFSAPKTDNVSSNLSDLRNPALPFQKLESTLKKPFDFDPVGRTDVRPARAPVPQPQIVPKRTMKEQLNDRAEAMFLNPELFKDSQDDRDLFGLTDDNLDPYKASPRNALERYQDRAERNQTTATNVTRSIDLLGEQRNALERGSGFSLETRPLNTTDPAMAPANRATGSDAFSNLPNPEEWNPARRPAPRQFDSAPQVNSDPFQNRSRANPTEARREEYQRLLYDPAHAHARTTGFGNAPTPSSAGPASAYRSPYQTTPTPGASSAVTPPAWASATPAAVSGGNSSFSRTMGFAGTPSELKPLPEYTVSATFKDMNTRPAQNESAVAPATAPHRPAKFQLPQRTY